MQQKEQMVNNVLDEKKNNDYCGTRMKGLPHGEINYTGVEKKKAQTIKAWEQEMNGVIYFMMMIIM